MERPRSGHQLGEGETGVSGTVVTIGDGTGVQRKESATATTMGEEIGIGDSGSRGA